MEEIRVSNYKGEITLKASQTIFDLKFSKMIYFLKVTDKFIVIKIIIYEANNGCQFFLEKVRGLKIYT